MIQVKIIYIHNDLRNFNYLVWDKKSGNTWVIDPYDPDLISNFIKKEGLNLVGILNTHHHWDHIKGNEALQNEFSCEILSNSSMEIALDEQHSLEILGTPGHTTDHKCFLWKNLQGSLGLFSGDTLFNAGVGNCRNGGNVEDLFSSTMRLNQLAEDIVLYPGHDYVMRNLMFAKSCEPGNPLIDEALKYVRSFDSEQGMKWTLKQEREVNPFLRLHSEEIQEKYQLKDSMELFIKLRSLRDQW